MSNVSVAKATVAPSRKRTHQIMAHSGFGDITVYNHGAKFVIPQRYVRPDGKVYHSVAKLTEDLTHEHIEALQNKGIQVAVGY